MHLRALSHVKSVLASALLATCLSACGGGKDTKSGDTTPTTPVGPPTKDQVIDIPGDALTASYFQPDALASPPVLLASTAKPKKLDVLRKEYKAAKGPAKAAAAEALASEVWRQFDSKEKLKEREEAVTVLREATADGKAPETTVAMLATFELLDGNKDKAAALDDDLITRFPQSKDAWKYKAQRSWFDLVAGDNAKAGERVKDADPAADATPAEVAYVAGWVKFRAGDVKGGWAAIGAAAKRWPYRAGFPALRREVMMFAAHAGVSATDALPLVTAMADKEPKMDLGRALLTFADAYEEAGEFEQRSAVLDVLGGQAEETLKKKDGDKASYYTIAIVRFHQSLVDMRLGRPEKASEHSLAAWAAADKAGDALDAASKDAIAGRVLEVAVYCHNVYAQTFDERYGQVAQKMYAAYAGIPGRPDGDKAKEYSGKLDQTMAGPEATKKNGTYNDGVLGKAIKLRGQELSSCYERWLQVDPKLAGEVAVSFIISDKGQVTKVDLKPAAGDAGLGAVAGCVGERVKGWGYPARTLGGNTGVTYKVTFAKSDK